MDKSDKVIRDMFLNNYGIFKSYERMKRGCEQDDEKILWRMDVMTNLDDLYSSAKAYSKIIASNPKKFGFEREDLEKKIKSMDEIVLSIYEEKDKYFPSMIN